MAFDSKRFRIVPDGEGVALQERNTHAPEEKDAAGEPIPNWRTLSVHADEDAAQKAAAARAKAKPKT
jgi:hypothetical protein